MKRKVRIDDGMGPAFYVDADEAARGTSNGMALIVVTIIGIVFALLGIGSGT